MTAALEGTLVLGGSGFLGAHVVASAVREARTLATMADPYGAPVHATSRDPMLAPRFCEPRDAALWEMVELTSHAALEQLLAECRPQAVINCVALSRMSDCEADPELARTLNAQLPGWVAAACATSGARCVHVSTDLVFGADPPRPSGYREDDRPQPLSVYGETKLAGEEAVLGANAAALVVRLPLLYGNSGGRNLGASDSLLAAVDRDEVPPLFCDEWRTPLEVTNAADALVELAALDVAGRLHVAGPERIDRYSLGLLALAAMGLAQEEAQACVRRAESSEVFKPGTRPRDVALDASRAARLLQTQLLAPREGLQRAMT